MRRPRHVAVHCIVFAPMCLPRATRPCRVGTGQRAPIDPLPMRGARCRNNASFEKSLSALVTRVLIPTVRALPHGCMAAQLGAMVSRTGTMPMLPVAFAGV